MKITKVSIFDGTEHTYDLDVTEAELKRWERGEHLIKAAPRLNADEREFLISGTPIGDWDALFPPETDTDLPNPLGE